MGSDGSWANAHFGFFLKDKARCLRREEARPKESLLRLRLLQSLELPEWHGGFSGLSFGGNCASSRKGITRRGTSAAERLL